MNEPFIGHGPRLRRVTWEGLDLILFENEQVLIGLLPGHGGDLIEFRHKLSDIDILWKNRAVWPPRSSPLPLPHAGRSEFYDRFHGGWFVSFPSGFFPGDYRGAPMGCHGEFLTLPAEWNVIPGDASLSLKLVFRGVRTPFRLVRTLTLKSGSPILDWREEVINDGNERMPFAILFHPGFGGPLIEGARLHTDAERLQTPPSQRPELNQLRADFSGPWPHAPEQNGNTIRDCSRMADADRHVEHVVILSQFKEGRAALFNERQALGFEVRWNRNDLPYAWSWMSSKGVSGYPIWGRCRTITIQPSSAPMLPFAELCEKNLVTWIEPGATKAYQLSAGFVQELAFV